MKIIQSDSITDAVSILQDGGLVISPSDTVYGACVDATNPKAVQKLIDFKARQAGKAISVFVGSLDNALAYVDVTDKQQDMLQELLPGAYTVVLPSKHVLDTKLEAENGTLGIRVPDYELVNELVQTFGKPITATSANMAGRSPHYSIESLINSLSKKKQEMIDAVIDVGKLPRNKPSTVIDLSGDRITTLREGSGTLALGKQTLLSIGELETKSIALRVLKASRSAKRDQNKPVVILLFGDLGVGKTVFVKGIAHELDIVDVSSPTFVIYYEYNVPEDSDFKKLYHFDLYRIQDSAEFEHLGFEEILQPDNLICIEWSEKSGDIIDMLRDKASIIPVEISHVSETEREIIIPNYV